MPNINATTHSNNEFRHVGLSLSKSSPFVSHSSLHPSTPSFNPSIVTPTRNDSSRPTYPSNPSNDSSCISPESPSHCADGDVFERSCMCDKELVELDGDDDGDDDIYGDAYIPTSASETLPVQPYSRDRALTASGTTDSEQQSTTSYAVKPHSIGDHEQRNAIDSLSDGEDMLYYARFTPDKSKTTQEKMHLEETICNSCQGNCRPRSAYDTPKTTISILFEYHLSLKLASSKNRVTPSIFSVYESLTKLGMELSIYQLTFRNYAVVQVTKGKYSNH